MRVNRKLAIVLSLVIFTTACPKVSESQLDKAAKHSRTVATRYVEVVKFVDTLYTGGAIKLETKDRIADGLIAFGEAGKKFNTLLASYVAQYKDGNVPANVWTVISQNFDQLSAEFLKVINLIPQASGLSSNPAFRAISAAILALATTLSTSGFSVPRLPQIQEGVNRNGLARLT